MWLWILGIVSSLGLVGTIAAAIAFPSVVIPILQLVLRGLIRCKPCLLLLSAIALLFVGALYGAHVESQRTETKLERQRQAAAAAAVQRDGEVRADLEKTFKPTADALRALNQSLQDKVDNYAKQKPAAFKPGMAAKPGKGAAACKLGDAAGLLQPPGPGKAAGAAKGGIADYLRRHPRKD